MLTNVLTRHAQQTRAGSGVLIMAPGRRTTHVKLLPVVEEVRNRGYGPWK